MEKKTSTAVNITGRKPSHFFSSYFCDKLFGTKSNDTSLHGKYNFEEVRRWHMKVPGYDIFKLKNLFIPININDNHWACIVKYIVEKQVEYNDSKGIGT